MKLKFCFKKKVVTKSEQIKTVSLMTGIRLVLPITTAGGVALPDSDVDQRAVGWSSAGGALRPCQVPHVVCLEVGFKICQFATEI